uniref:Uncharacterized protein n=1 Tax=Acrobeloides nanus TaxID=290746 RepID=A0A914CV84_9BILA
MNQTLADLFGVREFRVENELFWLIGGLPLCFALIVGCACYSLRVTRKRLKKGQDFEKNYDTSNVDDFQRVEISCDIDNPSSISIGDFTSNSHR